VNLVNPGNNVERGANASFHLQSLFLPSLVNNFTFTSVLHTNQNLITRKEIRNTSKNISSRFKSLNGTFNSYIPQNITTPNLFLTVYRLFELPGNLNIKKGFFASTTNIYLTSPAILSRVNVTENTHIMSTEITFDLGGSIENITEVPWTTSKPEQDERNPIEKLEDEFVKKQLSPMDFRKSTSAFSTSNFDKKVAFPKHMYINHRKQYRMFLHSKNIQPNGTISISKSFNKFTEHENYLISAMTVYNRNSSLYRGLYFTNQIRFTISPPSLTLHMKVPESFSLGELFQVYTTNTTVNNPSDKLYEGNVTLDYYVDELNKTRLSEFVKLGRKSWVNIIFPIVIHENATLVLDFQSDISPSFTVKKLVTVKQPINEESNIAEVNNQV